MKKLKNSEIFEMVENVKSILKGNQTMNSKVKKNLRQLGFQFVELGCGLYSKICSKEILVKMPLKMKHNRHFCQGKFLCVGLSNVICNGYYLYRAYAVEIETTEKEQKFINYLLNPREMGKFPRCPEIVEEYLENLKKEGHILINENNASNECKNEKATSEKGEESKSESTIDVAKKNLEKDIENETKIPSATA